jgi:hypothetical protein
MRSKLLLALACAVFLAASAGAQDGKKEKKVLTNADIVMMVQNHFDDETLLKVIEVYDTDFDTSSEALIDLKDKGVSSPVLRRMIQAAQQKHQAACHASASPAPAAAPEAVSSASSSSSSAPPATSVADKASQLARNSSPPPMDAPGTPSPSSTSNASFGNTAMPQMTALQSQMAAMGMGNMFGGMFSMNSYSPEQLPHVLLMDKVRREKQELAPSTAQIAQTKFKTGAPSPGASALRSLATQGLSFAAMGGGPGGMIALSAFSAASGFMPGMRPGTPSMTYVWGLPGRKSARELTTLDPVFELSYGDIPGVDPDAFEPAIVRLVQTPDNYRLVGATRTKMNTRNMMSGNGPENGKWISEDRWPTRVYKEERGFYVLRVDQPLGPGEYAVVLRPVKGYKATPSGLGGHAQVFYSVWDFTVPGATPEDTKRKSK